MKFLKKRISLKETVGKTIEGVLFDHGYHNIFSFDDSFVVMTYHRGLEDFCLRDDERFDPSDFNYEGDEESFLKMGIVDRAEYENDKEQKRKERNRIEEERERQLLRRLKAKYKDGE